ncbi:MAG: N-6 DNA methylase [Candidatus Paceibacterota bacterium]
MSEELIQRKKEKIGKYDYFNIGNTSLEDLKCNKIIPNKDYKEYKSRKPDGLIILGKKILGVVEFKKPSQFNNKKKKEDAIRQALDVAKILKAQVALATDGDDIIWINAINDITIKDENNNDLKLFFRNEQLLDKIFQSINRHNSKIGNINLIDPTPLAKSVWQDIWSVSGATPENCLYSFVEFFIFKYLSDLGVLREMYSFDALINQYENNTVEDVLSFYAGTIRKRIKEYFKPSNKDNTTIINGSIFINKDGNAVKGYGEVFKKVMFKFKDFGELKNIDLDFKSKLFESFLKESISKKNWGQFFTPLKVVRAIIRMTEIKEGMKICDPACGVGKFLLEPIQREIKKFYKIDRENEKIVKRIELFGFDKGFDTEEQKTIILAKANMLIYFSDLIKENIGLTKEFAELFNETFELKTNSILGTLEDIRKDEYDLILTNPPYITSGSSNLKKEIEKNKLDEKFYKINATGVEGLFFEWIVRALKPNGKAFVIIPDGILNRIYDERLRQFILDECFIDLIISLPQKTFFTTNKKTYIVGITKKEEKKEQKEPIFTYIVSNIGETLDINRFEINENDLEVAVDLYNNFKGSKFSFKTNDKRCKIQPITRFIKGLSSGWIIDKWWSEEERIKLGILEEKQEYNLEEFVAEISKLKNELDKELKNLEKLKKNVVNISNFDDFKIKDIFDIAKGKGLYTKKYINTHKGEYPVYSSQTSNDGIIGKINNFDYDEECLTWTTDGTYVGTVFYRNNKFSMTTHCGALFPKEKHKEKLYLPYLKSILNDELPKYKEGESSNKRLGSIKIADIEISLPTNKKNEPDFEIQKLMADKIERIEEIKNKLDLYFKKISDTKILFQ